MISPPKFDVQPIDEYSPVFEKSGHGAYRCFCSPDSLTETRETFARSGSNLTSDKRRLHLTDEEAARRVCEKSMIRRNLSNTFILVGLN